MASILRLIGSIVAGLLAAFVIIIGMELFSSVVHPFPPDFANTMEEMCAHVERYPNWVLAVGVVAWAGAAFLGTWITARLGNRGSALFTGFVLAAAAISNVLMLPYPAWFKPAIIVAIPLAAAAGIFYHARDQPARPSNRSLCR